MFTETDPATEQDNRERPEWLPENFLTPEDLAKSYLEGQRKITEQGQRMAELRRENEALRVHVSALELRLSHLQELDVEAAPLRTRLAKLEAELAAYKDRDRQVATLVAASSRGLQ